MSVKMSDAQVHSNDCCNSRKYAQRKEIPQQWIIDKTKRDRPKTYHYASHVDAAQALLLEFLNQTIDRALLGERFL